MALDCVRSCTGMCYCCLCGSVPVYLTELSVRAELALNVSCAASTYR